jgi:hypothetical protein
MRRSIKLFRAAGWGLLLAATLAAGPGRAHSWQDVSDPLSDDLVRTILAALLQLEDIAAQNGHVPPGKTPANLTVEIYDFATENDLLSLLPFDTQRALVTYEALQLGVVDATGAFMPDADSFAWSEVIHPQDVPAIAAHLGEFDAINSFFVGADR